MRDLSVYYCEKCGYYAYYQLPKNAVCPRCDSDMTLLDMRYQDFMALSYEKRDQLICDKIIASSASIVHRICIPSKFHNHRELIGHLTQELSRLEQENKELNETINWMHQTIWEQLRKTKGLEQELKELRKITELQDPKDHKKA